MKGEGCARTTGTSLADFLWILLATLFGASASGCTFINNLIGPEKGVVYKFDHPFNADDAAFRRSAEALGFPMVDGNQAVILQNGDAIFPAMIGEITNAKSPTRRAGCSPTR